MLVMDVATGDIRQP